MIENLDKPLFNECFESSGIDPYGTPFFYNERVFRAIHHEQAAKKYKAWLNQSILNNLKPGLLIPTQVTKELSFADIPLVLEHERVPFQTNRY